MCQLCLRKAPMSRRTFDIIVRLGGEPRYSDGVPPLDMAAPLGFDAVPRLAAFLGVVRQKPGKKLADADATAVCEISSAIVEQSKRGTLQRSAQKLLDKRAGGQALGIEDAERLSHDLVATVINTIQRRVSELRDLLEKCPVNPGRRLTVTHRRYKIVPLNNSASFDAGQMLPLMWWMCRPAWRNAIGCWEKTSLKIVHLHFRRAVTTGLLCHDDGRPAGEIPKLDSIPDPEVRTKLHRALDASEMFSRVLDLFYEARGDDLVLRYRAREHGRRAALFLSAARLFVVVPINELLAGWAEPLQPDAYLGRFPHQSARLLVPRTSLEELEAEYEALFQLGLNLWSDEEAERRRLGPGPGPGTGPGPGCAPGQGFGGSGDSVPPPG